MSLVSPARPGLSRRALLALPAAFAGLTACTSPEPLYYTLQTRPGPVRAGGPKLVELRRIGLAGYLDRPEIVRNNAEYRLAIDTRQRWGEPLGNLVARTLADDLNLRLPGTSVFTSSGALSVDPDVTVELDLQRFDADADGQVVLLAQIAVSRARNRGGAVTRTIRLTEAPADATTAALVAALSAALGQLANQIVPLLAG